MSKDRHYSFLDPYQRKPLQKFRKTNTDLLLDVNSGGSSIPGANADYRAVQVVIYFPRILPAFIDFLEGSDGYKISIQQHLNLMVTCRITATTLNVVE